MAETSKLKRALNKCKPTVILCLDIYVLFFVLGILFIPQIPGSSEGRRRLFQDWMSLAGLLDIFSLKWWEKRKSSWWRISQWLRRPSVSDKKAAFQAAQRSATAAFVFAAIFAVWPATISMLKSGKSWNWAFVDAVVFVFLGWRVIRTASVKVTIALLVLIVCESANNIISHEGWEMWTRGWASMLVEAFWLGIFVLQFSYGVIGAFAYRRYLTDERGVLTDAERNREVS
jgi:hypothetical protein